MKRAYISLLVLAVLGVGIFWGSSSLSAGHKKQSSELDTAFNQTGAIFENLTVSGWGKLNNQFLSPEQLSSFVGRTAEKIGLHQGQGDLQVDSRKAQDYCGVTMRGKLSERVSVELSGQSVNTLEGAGPETYVTMVIKVKNQDKGSRYWVEKAKNALDQVAVSQVAAVITGKLDQELSEDAKKELMNRVFNYLDAEKAEDIANREMLGWTGYSPYLTEKLRVGERDINLNMVVRSSSASHKTSVLVGMPIIAVEY